MRILHVADFVSEKTGYQDFLLPKFHARHGHEVHIVASCWNPPAPNYAASFEPLLGPRVMDPGVSTIGGVTIHRLPVRWERRNRVILAGLAEACRDISPDVVFVHDTMTPTALRMVRIARSLRVPLYFDNHGIFSVQNRSHLSRTAYFGFRRVMHHYMAPRTTRFYGVATECMDFLVEAQGAPRSKVALLPLGVDTDLFHPDPTGGLAWRERHGVEPGAFVVTQTGKLDPSKDPITLAKAVAQVNEVPGQPLHLVLVGSGPEGYVRSLVDAVQLNSHHRVLVLPPVQVSELRTVFSGSDALCYPGGTSMSSLEAAACGRIVIMNDEAVSRWRAELGIGLTFRERDVSNLAGVLERLRLMPPRERADLERRAFQAAQREFSYEKIARSLESDMSRDLADAK